MSFKDGARIGWETGEINNQFRREPPRMAPVVKTAIGVFRFQSESVSDDIGVDFRSLHRRLIENRIE